MHWFERIAQRRIDEAAAKGQLQGLRVGELSAASLDEFMKKIVPARD